MVACVSSTADGPCPSYLRSIPAPRFISKSAGREPLGSLSGICLHCRPGFESPRPETLARPPVGNCHGQGSGLFRICVCDPAGHAMLGAADEMAPTLRAAPGRSSSYMR